MATKASDVMRRWFQEVWCEGNPATIAELFPAHGLAHGLGAEPVRGPEAFLEFWRGFRATFRDLHIRVDDALDEGPMTYVRCTARMKHANTPVVLAGGCQARIEDGKIAECWNTWDFVTLLTQMGALPPDVLGRAFAGGRARFD